MPRHVDACVDTPARLVLATKRQNAVLLVEPHQQTGMRSARDLWLRRVQSCAKICAA